MSALGSTVSDDMLTVAVILELLGFFDRRFSSYLSEENTEICLLAHLSHSPCSRSRAPQFSSLLVL